MYRRILVPLDGSTLAEQAIPVAARLARTTGGSVLLVRVVSVLQDFSMYTAGTSPYLQDILDEALRRAKTYLAQMSASLPLDGVDTRVAVFSGSIAEEILNVVREEQIDLVVMSSHGSSGFKRWALGSIAQKMVHHCSVPVLLLRKRGQSFHGLAQKVPHPLRTLVALDGSLFAEAALLPAAAVISALSDPARGELHLIQLTNVPTVAEEMTYRYLGIDVDLRQAELRQCGDYLHTLRERLSRELATIPVDITWSVEESNDVAETLIKRAERGEGIGLNQPCDLMVMATHGRSGLQRWFSGSITERVLDHSSLPILVVRPTEQAPRALSQAEGVLQGVGLD